MTRISKDLRRILLTAIAILGVMGACVLLIRLPEIQATIRDGLIIPIYYILWLSGLFIGSIDQIVLWAVALIGMAMLLMYGIAAARPFQNPFDEPVHREENLLPPAYGRVRFWKNRIDSLRSQGIDSDYALHEFRRLTREVTEISGDNADADAGPNFVAGEISSDWTVKSQQPDGPIPEHLAVFLEPPKPVASEFLGKNVQSWRRWLPRHTKTVIEPDSTGDRLVELTEFLEDKLEIEHGDHD